MEWLSRTTALLGEPAIEKLRNSKVALFGVGGVGGYALEILARSGVGNIDLFDNDVISTSNINRQIIALHHNVGQKKVEAAKERVLDINPECNINAYPLFYQPANADETDLSTYDYVIDCIDTMSAKIELIKRCHSLHVPILCSMGAANKMEPTSFKVADINHTKYDPLARVIRKKLKELHIPKLKVVYSDEQPRKTIVEKQNGRNTPASNAFVPAVAGIIIGAEAVKDLIAQVTVTTPMTSLG
ncbi:MAG: ThiF family adenylyltransferase [Prevotella sp.]